jgi:hypothetical protein
MRMIVCCAVCFCLQNLPFYKMVVAPQRAPRDGKHLEVVGWYNPHPCKQGQPGGREEGGGRGGGGGVRPKLTYIPRTTA